MAGKEQLHLPMAHKHNGVISVFGFSIQMHTNMFLK